MPLLASSLALLLSASPQSLAQDAAEPKTPPFGAIHEFKDWELACDNGHRCSAAGYSPEDSAFENSAALFISREAGPDGAIQIKIVVGEEESQKVNLTIGSFHLDSIALDEPIPSSAIPAALSAITKETTAKITTPSGKKEWAVSLSGASAALLKMDDLQGRVGTPGAIVRKGPKPESSVPPAPPLPTVKRVPFLPSRPGDAARLKPILAALGKAGCEQDGGPPPNTDETAIFRISASQVLVTQTCWLAAYQGGSGVWLANDKPPYAPVKLQFPDATGLHDEEPTSLGIEKNGKASSGHKGRGLGDCGDYRDFAWTGRRFALVSETANNLCRGIHGGVELQLWRATETVRK